MFYFKSHQCDPPAEIYMGRDKFENDELLKFADHEDIWFHVNDLSSAHVYLRLQSGWTIGSIPEAVLNDCCQLVKSNSIEGCKLPTCKIVYTPVSNLRKEAGFDTGSVAFHSTKALRFRTIQKEAEVAKRVSKTKEERTVDFKAEALARQKEAGQRKRAEEAAAKKASLEAERKRREEADLMSYSTVMKKDKMSSNHFDEPVDINSYEEDFFG